MKITVDKMKILGITIPTNGKYEDLIDLNYDEKRCLNLLDLPFAELLPSLFLAFIIPQKIEN
jgi:uncharacterized protein YceK